MKEKSLVARSEEVTENQSRMFEPGLHLLWWGDLENYSVGTGQKALGLKKAEWNCDLSSEIYSGKLLQVFPCLAYE